MFSTRILSFFLLLVSFGAFACAKPIVVAEHSDLIVGGEVAVSDAATLAALVNLTATLTIIDAQLDGRNTAHWNDVIVALNANVAILAAVTPETAHGPNFDEISIKVAAIIKLLAAAGQRYNAIAWLLINARLNIALNLWLGTLGGVIPGLSAVVSGLLGGLSGSVSGFLGIHL